MASFNKVILMGNLTRDPELRVTQGGMSICKFGIATSRQTKAPDGTAKEETAFIDVDAFGKQADTIGKYLSKGRPILIEGRLRLDQWETQTGEKRSKLCVVLEGFQFVGARADDGAGQLQVDEGGVRQEAPIGLVEDLSRSGSKSGKQANVDMRIDDNVPF
jgi:single-strand DNA-binding protein